MPTIQLRNIPQKLYDKIVERSKKERRSITQQSILLLEDALNIETVVERKARRRMLFEEIKNINIDFTGVPTPTEIIRKDRDSR